MSTSTRVTPTLSAALPLMLIGPLGNDWFDAGTVTVTVGGVESIPPPPDTLN